MRLSYYSMCMIIPRDSLVLSAVVLATQTSPMDRDGQNELFEFTVKWIFLASSIFTT